MTSSSTAPQRLAWVDALRVIDSAFVVLVHADYLARPDPFTWWPAGIYSTLGYGLCVPLFFVVAGFVGARSSERDLFRRALRLLPLLAAHGVVLMLLGVRDEPTLAGIVVTIASGVWYLYFVSALVQILLLHAIGQRFAKDHARALFIAAVASTTLAYAATSANLWLVGADMGRLELRLRSLAPCWIGFYAVGVAIGRRPSTFERLVRRRWWLVLATLVFFAGFMGEVFAQDATYNHALTLQALASGLPFQLTGSLAAMAFMAHAEATSARARSRVAMLARAGPATLAIYLLHGTFMWLLYGAWMRHQPVVHPLEVPVLATLAALLSIVTSFVARWLPEPLPWVIAGVTRARSSRRPSP